MCGITGFFSFNNSAETYRSKIDAAVEAIKSRGPDSNGLYIDKNVGFGHTRLSIIDTSDAGSQPFIDSSGRYALVFNGEFYNHNEYRAELVSDGIKFKSGSDTEVLLYLLIKYGENAIEKINGCFAFAFYDSISEKIIAARDRMGINPLVYYTDSEKFIFASEMKALYAFGIPKELNTAAVYTYFQLNYLPANISMLKNVNKLEPGNYLVVDKSGISVKSYYKIPNSVLTDNYDDYQTASKKLRDLLDSAVERRLMSDVPLGCFLSGGIDSTVITALAAGHTKHLNTFSIGFKDEEFFDETSFAEIVAKRYKTNHTSFKISNDDLLNNLTEMLDYLDEPFADSSALAVNILSKLTRTKVTVALSGDGADEIFAGYNKHAAHFNASYARAKEKIAAAMNPLWKVVPKSRNSKVSNFARQLDRFATGFKLSPDERYWYWASIGSESYVSSLLDIPIDYAEFSQRKNKYVNSNVGLEDINQVLYTDMQLILPGDMLTKTDLMSMANSLEVRTPFLDHTVVNYAFSLPSHYKINSNQRKKILKDCCSDLIPKELINRPKHGFEVPLLKWFRNELWQMIDKDLLSEEFVTNQGLFNYNEISKLKKKIFSSGPEDSAAKIWALIVFQHWWKKYFI
jgi:asparagine synthase (glutamine-hydrolysing)